MLNVAPPAAPRPIRPFDNSSIVEVSAWTRAAENPSLGLTTKVVPLVISTIGGATIPALVPDPTERVANVPDVGSIWWRVPFELPTISFPRTELRSREG